MRRYYGNPGGSDGIIFMTRGSCTKLFFGESVFLEGRQHTPIFSPFDVPRYIGGLCTRTAIYEPGFDYNHEMLPEPRVFSLGFFMNGQ